MTRKAINVIDKSLFIPPYDKSEVFTNPSENNLEPLFHAYSKKANLSSNKGDKDFNEYGVTGAIYISCLRDKLITYFFSLDFYLLYIRNKVIKNLKEACTLKKHLHCYSHLFSLLCFVTFNMRI